jgi:tetratricopeptide (TPR) repeat protein
MLVSIVMGLIDHSSGLLYYINAEHPFIVLYRDGKSQFLPNQFIYRKLGSPITGALIEIQTFQMEPFDRIILGSDGRDDIILFDKNPQGELNSDERFFLNLVNSQQGDLEKIYQYYAVQPEILTDDLSLMSLELAPDYTPPNLKWRSEKLPDLIHAHLTDQELLESWKKKKSNAEKNPYLFKQYAIIFHERGMHEHCYEAASRFIDFDPSDLEMIYITSHSARKIGNFLDSIDLGERVRIRNSAHLANLVNLAKSYLSLGIKERVKQILELLKNLDPNSTHINDIEKKI